MNMMYVLENHNLAMHSYISMINNANYMYMHMIFHLPYTFMKVRCFTILIQLYTHTSSQNMILKFEKN